MMPMVTASPMKLVSPEAVGVSVGVAAGGADDCAKATVEVSANPEMVQTARPRAQPRVRQTASNLFVRVFIVNS